jgi:hypothetical protein
MNSHGKKRTGKSVTLWLPVDFPLNGKELKYFIERVGKWAGKFKSTPESRTFQIDNRKFLDIFLKIDEYYAVTER